MFPETPPSTNNQQPTTSTNYQQADHKRQKSKSKNQKVKRARPERMAWEEGGTGALSLRATDLESHAYSARRVCCSWFWCRFRSPRCFGVWFCPITHSRFPPPCQLSQHSIRDSTTSRRMEDLPQHTRDSLPPNLRAATVSRGDFAVLAHIFLLLEPRHRQPIL